MLEEWILALAASPLVYLALYLFATIDGIFPPMPSESVVIALAAVAMSTGAPNLWIIVAVAAAGAFTGDQVAYAIGRRVNVRGSRLFRGPRAQRTLDWAEHALTHRGASFIIGGRYIPIGRVAVNMTAGAVGFSRPRFVGLTAIAAVSWAFYSTAIGIGAGAWLQGRPVVAVAVGVVAGGVIGFGVDTVLSRVQGRPRLRRLGVAPPPAVPAEVPASEVQASAVPLSAMGPSAVPPAAVLPAAVLSPSERVALPTEAPTQVPDVVSATRSVVAPVGPVEPAPGDDVRPDVVGGHGLGGPDVGGHDVPCGAAGVRFPAAAFTPSVDRR